MTPAVRRHSLRILVIAMAGAPSIAWPVSVTVNDPSDALHSTGCAATGTGTCTLRDAITFSNQNPGKDSIAPAAGLATISPASPLPPLVDVVELRGDVDPPLTQRGFHLVGSNAGASTRGLLVQASDSVVDGLLVDGFGGSGIVVTGHRNVIGAPSGIYLRFTVVGVGNEVRGNGGHGIEVLGGSGNYVYNNLVSLNRGAGVYLADGAVGNRVGDHYTYDAGQGYEHYYYNVLFANALAGIQIGRSTADVATTGNLALFNIFLNNGGLIDLAGDGTTPNDAGDGDTGPNGLQNSPTITLAWDGTKYRIDGTLQTSANTSFGAHAHSSQPWPGRRTPIGIAGGSTDPSGMGSFSIGLDALEDARPSR